MLAQRSRTDPMASDSLRAPVVTPRPSSPTLAPQSVDHRSSPEADSTTIRAGLRGLQQGWQQASLVRKASLVLVVPALLCALATVGASSRSAQARAPLAPAAETPVPAATAMPAATATHAPTAATARSAAPAPSSPSTTPKPGTAALRDTRTAERKALDAAIAGADAEAAEQYAELAAAHPDNVAFREAARILRARASAPRE